MQSKRSVCSSGSVPCIPSSTALSSTHPGPAALQVSLAYEAAVAQRSGKPRPAGDTSGTARPRETWAHQQQHRYHQDQWRHQQQTNRRQHRHDQSERMRAEHKRASAFIERVKGSVLVSAVLLCVLFSGTPSSRDDIFSPVRRLLGTQRGAKPAASGVMEMEIDEAPGKLSSGTQRHTAYPAQWMAQAVKEEAQRYPQGYGNQPAHGAPMGAAGVALAKSEWLSRQSHEKYSVAVEDIEEAQRRAREGQPPRVRPISKAEGPAIMPTDVELGMAE
jgi:hypothetical protein